MNSQVNAHSILIVDDNPQNLQVLGKILQENKFEIEFAISGETALAWLEKKEFDLVLLDINMAGMNGFEVCMKIRSNKDLNNMPVIFLSAETDRESILKGFEFGAQDYATKPFDSRELLARVRTQIKLKESLENLENINQTLEKKVDERTHQLKEANDKLEMTNYKLRDLDKTKSEFLHLISHEIRTPLNGIIGPMEILKEQRHDPEYDDLFNILDISVRRLEQFSLNALLITRLETDPTDIKKESIQFKNLLSEFLHEVKDKFLAKGILVDLQDGTNDGTIMGEAGLLKKCIGNILENAIRFSPKDGKIIVRIYFEGQKIICEIIDNGEGFPKGVLGHQFELFTTGNEYKDNTIGIGLPISKMIMEAHGGSIKISNKPSGSGAIVKLSFKETSKIEV